MAEQAAWEKLNQLFEKALTLPEAERETWMQRLAAEEPDLATELQALLQSYADATGYFSDMEAGLSEAMYQMSEDPLAAGTQVGPYQVVDRLGGGGMSVIYRARRTDVDFEQIVALKVLKKGLDTDDILRRFRYEKQILARLSHPGIAQIYDGGATAEGTPYFVMELIDGLPLDRYAEEQQLDLRARLQLFLKVCRPLQYAHRNLVIHRDLKPSNILVTAEGNVKLLDFGIAKLLTTDAYDLTQAGQQLLTPEYAAPEQLSQGLATTSTDVYQLGLILYELLAGQRPFDFANASMQERSRIIQEEMPLLPSQRATDPRRRRALQGDLDNIVRMALRKEPDRRYASVEQLIQDLEAHLAGRPVQARKDTVSYRLGKFYQRNRVPVILGSIALLLIATLTTVYTLRVTAERDRAQAEAQKARRTSEFMQGLFYQTSELAIRGEEVTPEKLLAMGLEKLDTLQAAPTLKAYLYQAVGLTYMGMGLEESAEEPLLKAIELRPEGSTPGQEEADALLTLGTIYYSRGLNDQADSLLKASLAINQSLPSPEYSSMINLLVSLAELAISQENYGQAQSYADQAQAMALARQDTNSEFYANVLFAQGYCYLVQENYPAAQKSMGDMRQLALRMSDGKASPLLAGASHNLAEVYLRSGQLQKAQQYESEAIDAYRSTIQAPSNYFLDMLKTQGSITQQLKQYPTSLAIQEEVRDLSLLLYADQPAFPPAYAGTLLDLSELYRDLDRLDSALSTGRAALAIERQQLSADDPQLGVTHLSLSRTYMVAGKLDSARYHLTQGRAVLAGLPEDHQRRLQLSLTQGQLLLAEGKAQAAADTLQQLSQRYAQLDPPRIAGAVSVLQARSRAHQRLGQTQKARTCLEQARDLLVANPSDLHQILLDEIRTSLAALG